MPPKWPIEPAILAKRLRANDFSTIRPEREQLRIRLGGRGFQKIKQPLRIHPVFDAKSSDICAPQQNG
jgi:hypothetical protein